MPRKRKAGTAKLFRQYEKDSLREYAESFVAFFNIEDPIELFRNDPDFKEIAGDAEVQDKLRQSFNKVREAIKAVIVAYEDFWQGRTKDAIKALQKAANEVNLLPTMWVRHILGVRNDGHVDASGTGFKADEKAEEEYILNFATFKIGSHIENFKGQLARYKEHFPIGVCRYEKCHEFFVKKRKDELYCTKSHAKLSWQLEKRKEHRPQ